MSEISKETGVITALAKRLVEQTLPKALALKERVDRGEVLNDLDMAFLEEIVRDAGMVRRLIKEDPRVLEVAGNVVPLFQEIMDKALENEKAQKGS